MAHYQFTISINLLNTMAKNNYWFKWDQNHSARPEIAALIAKHGDAGYGLYTRVREVIARFDGECPIEIVCSQLGTTPEKLAPLIDNKCYAFVMGLLSDESIKSVRDHQKKVSEKRSRAGKKGMAERWNETPEPAPVAKKKGTGKKNGSPVLSELQFETPENSGITNVIIDRDRLNKKDSNNKLLESPPSGKEITNVIFKNCMEIYTIAYQSWCDTNPMIEPADGAALKKIIAHLTKSVAVKKEKNAAAKKEKEITVEMAWQHILDRKYDWGQWESSRVRLRDIASNLNNIILNIKKTSNGTTGSKQSGVNGANGGTKSRIANSLQRIDEIEL